MKQTAARMIHGADVLWHRTHRAALRRTTERILTQPDPPQPYGEEVFDELMRTCKKRTSYRYDPFSLWKRSSSRVVRLLGEVDLKAPGARVLEAGCGDGTMGYLFDCYGHPTTLTDLEDWRDVRARELPFLQGDLCAGLDLPSDHFELVYSYNTFEHVGDPAAALDELVRLCKPGGFVHLKFGPLYPSAWGLHAYKTVPIPYVQHLFAPELIGAKLRHHGIHDLGRDREELQPLNRWRLTDFERLWRRPDCVLRTSSTNENYDHLDVIRRFKQAFTGRGLTFRDVVTKSVRVTLQKKPS